MYTQCLRINNDNRYVNKDELKNFENNFIYNLKIMNDNLLNNINLFKKKY